MKLYLNGNEYKGKAAFINGYNGYSATENNGLLCALIDNNGVLSCFDKDGKPNALKNGLGEKIVNKALRGTTIVVANGYLFREVSEEDAIIYYNLYDREISIGDVENNQQSLCKKSIINLTFEECVKIFKNYNHGTELKFYITI